MKVVISIILFSIVLSTASFAGWMSEKWEPVAKKQFGMPNWEKTLYNSANQRITDYENGLIDTKQLCSALLHYYGQSRDADLKDLLDDERLIRLTNSLEREAVEKRPSKKTTSKTKQELDENIYYRTISQAGTNTIRLLNPERQEWAIEITSQTRRKIKVHLTEEVPEVLLMGIQPGVYSLKALHCREFIPATGEFKAWYKNTFLDPPIQVEEGDEIVDVIISRSNRLLKKQ